MARSKSSQRWLKDHFDDPYVKRAQQAGYRSRAVYKLLELQERDHLLTRGRVVVDLGAAPGGWSQVAAQCLGKEGRIIASDILPMDPLPGVEFLQGDFTQDEVFVRLLEMLNGAPVDLVMSDMAPNISGMRAVDQPRAMYLAELALDFAQKVLRPGGDLVMKVFQGEGFDEFSRVLRGLFQKVVIRKPAASRPSSREVYVVATGFKR